MTTYQQFQLSKYGNIATSNMAIKVMPVMQAVGETIFKSGNISITKCLDGYTVTDGTNTIVVSYLPPYNVAVLKGLLKQYANEYQEEELENGTLEVNISGLLIDASIAAMQDDNLNY